MKLGEEHINTSAGVLGLGGSDIHHNAPVSTDKPSSLATGIESNEMYTMYGNPASTNRQFNVTSWP